jgi:hypothetical protein
MLDRLGHLDKTHLPAKSSRPPVFSLNPAAPRRSNPGQLGRVTGSCPTTKDRGRIVSARLMAMTPAPEHIWSLVTEIRQEFGDLLINRADPWEGVAWLHKSGFHIAGAHHAPFRIGHVNLPFYILVTDGGDPEFYYCRDGMVYLSDQIAPEELNQAMGLLKAAAIVAGDRNEGRWQRTA